jgi:hypothetical protein
MIGRIATALAVFINTGGGTLQLTGTAEAGRDAATRARRLDPIATFLLAADGVTVLVGLASQSPAITMLGQHIPGCSGGLGFWRIRCAGPMSTLGASPRLWQPASTRGVARFS